MRRRHPLAPLFPHSTRFRSTSPICHPTGPHQSHKYTKNTTKVNRFSLVLFFLGKEGYSPLKNRIYHILGSHPTLSACWGGTSPICHPTGPHQSHKYTKNTTEVTRFSLVLYFLGKEGYSPLKNRIYHILGSHPTLSACWGGT